MFMGGIKEATVRDVRLVDIHGTRYYDISYTHDDTPETLRAVRVGVEDAYPGLQAGDAVRVRYLMNVAVGVARRDD